jgi:hypothetical protein
MGRSKRPKRKGKRTNGRRPHKKHSKPARNGSQGTAKQGTKRLLVRSEPDHRKRRKKR